MIQVIIRADDSASHPAFGLGISGLGHFSQIIRENSFIKTQWQRL